MNQVFPVENGFHKNGRSNMIVVAVDDLFFLARIQETARQLGVTVDIARTAQQVMEKAVLQPALIIFDLNSNATRPLEAITEIRKNPELKKTCLIAFVSHVQAELKLKAQEAGCDLVMPRSAFSQNLPTLLKRHGLPESV